MVHFKYGITKDQYKELVEKFPVCASCHEDFGSYGPTVDHSHETGAIRALLCTDCNSGLGRFKDNRERLVLAIAYLDKYDK